MHRYSHWLATAFALGLVACAPSSTIPKGEPLPPTYAPTAVPLEAEREKPARGPCPSLARCAPVLHDVVVSNWRMPPGRTGRKLKATLLVDVKPDGFIRSIKVTQGSGNGAFDRSAVSAVEESQPFVELRGLAEVQDNGGTQLQFVFVPR